jgi:phage/plasmid-like protein (TIGR03299 family)
MTEIQHYGESRYVDSNQRKDAFHLLGTQLDPRFTAEEAMAAAKLGGWNVRKVPLQTVPLVEGDEEYAPMPVAKRFATVRTNPFDGKPQVIGVVGNIWTAIQNEDHAELLNTLVDQSGAHFETAGANADGTEAFMAMKLPDTMQVGGLDAVDTYITAFNSHDGTSSFRFAVTPVRVRCANMQSMALRAAQSKFNIRHTRNSKQAMQVARESLGLTFKYVAAFEEEAQKLIQETLTNDAFLEIVDTLWVPDTAAPTAQQQTAQERRGTLLHLFEESDTNENIRGTKWAGLQAFSEWTDHFATIRGQRGEALVEARARRAISDSTSTWVKNRAFDLLSA